MDNQNRKLELLGNAPIPKALLAMGIPTMIGMLAVYDAQRSPFCFRTAVFRIQRPPIFS